MVVRHVGGGGAYPSIKQEMARVNIIILGISELKWTRMGEFTTGISAFPLGWPWEAQSSPRVARESWGLRSSPGLYPPLQPHLFTHRPPNPPPSPLCLPLPDTRLSCPLHLDGLPQVFPCWLPVCHFLSNMRATTPGSPRRHLEPVAPSPPGLQRRPPETPQRPC